MLFACAAPYPGVTLDFFPRDRRPYRRLVIACDNPSSSPLALNIRIDDMRHSNEHDDRFNATFSLAPGANEITVPLERVRTAPRGRRMDMARLRTVMIFAHRLAEPRELVLQSIRLE